MLIKRVGYLNEVMGLFNFVQFLLLGGKIGHFERVFEGLNALIIIN